MRVGIAVTMSTPDTAALVERIEVLEAAIRWALGEEGEFPPEPEPVAGKYRRRYWWRAELRERAALTAAPAPCSQCADMQRELNKIASEPREAISGTGGVVGHEASDADHL